MTLAVKLLLIAALVLGIIIPFGTFLLGEKSKNVINVQSEQMHSSFSEHLS